MKTPTIKTLTLLAAAACTLAPAGAFAQSTESAPTTATAPVYPVVHTLSGNFRATDGNSGAFVETITANSATSRSAVTVFTRAKDGATSTDKSSTVINPDGTRTVDFSATGYGATASFTSHKTVSKETHGQFSGQGTYTTAAGVSGTLTTLETRAEIVSVVSTVYLSAAGLTSDLRLEEDGFGFTTVKTINLDPAGKVTTVVHTRYVTSSK